MDLILTSNEALVENINIEEPFASSDHCVVKFDITCNIIRKDWKLCYYDYRHGNYEAMKVYLAEMDWSIFINCEDVIEVWSRFIKMMKDLVVKFVPKKMRKTVKKPMWWNKHIQNLGRKKTRSWDRYKLDKTEGNYTSYNNALNKNTDAIRQAKRRLEKKIAKNIKSDPKMTTCEAPASSGSWERAMSYNIKLQARASMLKPDGTVKLGKHATTRK